MIINVEQYDDSDAYPKRLGSDVDVRDLKSVWTKFGCDVHVVTNPTATKMIETVQAFQHQGSLLQN